MSKLKDLEAEYAALEAKYDSLDEEYYSIPNTEIEKRDELVEAQIKIIDKLSLVNYKINNL